jgi:hypothetical protein
MSHIFHDRTQPIQRARTQTGKLPGGFGALTGHFDHWTLTPERSSKTNKNHIYVWLAVPGGQFGGKYEAAVNVLSEDGSTGTAALLQYLQINEAVPVANWPPPGWDHAKLSFSALKLMESEFTVVNTGELRSLVVSYATTCQQITIYGTDYPDGTGLHDVHLNSGNPPGTFPNEVDQDGAIAFFFDAAHGGPIVRWLYLKFQSQTI